MSAPRPLVSGCAACVVPAGSWATIGAQVARRYYSAVQHWGRAFFMIVSDPDRLNGELVTVLAAKPTAATVRGGMLAQLQAWVWLIPPLPLSPDTYTRSAHPASRLRSPYSAEVVILL